MTLADIINGFYKGNTITVIECTHNLATGEENYEEITGAKSEVESNLTYNQLYKAKVVMFEAVKKNTIKVWTYREV